MRELEHEPNFRSVEAETVTEHDINSAVLDGKIVFIESADPGYDFLFTKGISGLITLYGGANSHMAIRCAVLGLPAVIGAGRRNFEEWSRSKVLQIDCSSKKVAVVL